MDDVDSAGLAQALVSRPFPAVARVRRACQWGLSYGNSARSTRNKNGHLTYERVYRD